jgi:hypothetical protein
MPPPLLTRLAAASLLLAAIARPADRGDFNWDAHPDIAWQNDITRQVCVWFMNGSTMTGFAHPAPGVYPGWRLAAVADMDNNGVPDLVWQNETTRSVGTWYMDGPQGTTLLRTVYQAPDSYPGWRLVGVADFDNNGVMDFAWQHDDTRQMGVWYMAGPDSSVQLFVDWPAPGTYPGWRVVGIADMDNNGVPDIVWQEDTTRSVGTWYMSGPRGINLLEIQYQQPNSYPGWTIAGVADYDGNGVQDLIWQNDSTRVLGIWYMGGAKAMTKLSENMQMAAPEPGWRAVMPRVTAWTASGSPSFSLASPLPVTVVAGQSASTTVTVIPANGFSSAVTFGAVGWPTGLSGVFTPVSVTGSPSWSSALTVTAAGNVAPGVYSLSFSGTSVSPALVRTGTVQVTVTAAQQTAPPLYDPPAWAYPAPLKVTLASATQGAAIVYTVDGSNPAAAYVNGQLLITNGQQYQSAVPIAGTVDLKAIAVKNGMTNNAASGRYRTPIWWTSFSPKPGVYSAGQTVYLANATPGVSIYYTTDGSDPRTSSTKVAYTAGQAITITNTTTIKAVGAVFSPIDGWVDSGVTTGIYNIASLSTTPLSPHTRLEVNMGFIYFLRQEQGFRYPWYGDTISIAAKGQYDDFGGFPVMASYCTSGVTARGCIKEILAKYKEQGITGVRFQFFIHEALNIPLGNEGQSTLRPEWKLAVQRFFQDLYDAGIYDITPTVDWEGADVHAVGSNEGDRYTYTQAVTPRGNCSGYPYTEQNGQARWWRFTPTSPHGHVCTGCSGAPQDPFDLDYGWGSPLAPDNKSYDCSPANPKFVGWNNLYSVVDALLDAARRPFDQPGVPDPQNRSLNISEFDLQNEILLSRAPLRARLIVDNTHGNEDVLGQIRQRMQNRGFYPDRVTYSSMESRSNASGWDCGSVYGDSARVMDLSQVIHAIAGGQLAGQFGNASPHAEGQLPCLLTYAESQQKTPEQIEQDRRDALALMIYLPITHSLPSVLDIHSSPCVEGNNDCDPAQWTAVTGEARLVFNALSALRSTYPQLANASITLGETHGRVQPGCQMCLHSAGCANGQITWDPAAAVNTILGFNTSTLANVTLPSGQPGYTTLRPWEYLMGYKTPPLGGNDTTPDPVACNPIVIRPPYTATP